MLETLELGTDGVLLKTFNPEELKKPQPQSNSKHPSLHFRLQKSERAADRHRRPSLRGHLRLNGARRRHLGRQPIAGLFLVEAEVHENVYVASRPFRVNAGSLSMYTLGNMQNTRYLSD